MDQLGVVIAEELARVKLELKREKRRHRDTRESREMWKHRALVYSGRRKLKAAA